MNPVLSLKNVVKRYHNHLAVDKVSFDIESGVIFGLLGPNGAGKTSIIRMITSITSPDEGAIFFEWRGFKSISSRKNWLHARRTRAL